MTNTAPFVIEFASTLRIAITAELSARVKMRDAFATLLVAMDSADKADPDAIELFRNASIAAILKLPKGLKGIDSAIAVRKLKPAQRTTEQTGAIDKAKTWVSRTLKDLGLATPAKPRGPKGGFAGAATPTQEKIGELETQLMEAHEQVKAARREVPKLTSSGATTDLFRDQVAFLSMTARKNPGKFLAAHRNALAQIKTIVDSLGEK